jgi:hypothetical protein
LDQPVTVVAPLPALELAGRTARRAAAGSERASLLPAEFTARYHQQFVDRLWLRALLATGVLYSVLVAIYFCAVSVLGYQTGKSEDLVAAQGGSYTNAMQTIARYQVLKEREDLKFAALDSLQVIAEQLPAGVSLGRLSFQDGRKITLSGSVPPDDIKKIIDFDEALGKATLKDQPMFDPGDQFSEHALAGQVAWNFGLLLKNTEATSK